ncbi:hypothetical protein [Actinoplanes missouriensis]|nr:hypothetical protein [Actinoplanes missouriensis]
MRRWTTYLWQALAALADSEYPIGVYAPPPRPFHVDLDDDVSVRAAFTSIVEWNWGPGR